MATATLPSEAPAVTRDNPHHVNSSWDPRVTTRMELEGGLDRCQPPLMSQSGALMLGAPHFSWQSIWDPEGTAPSACGPHSGVFPQGRLGERSQLDIG